LLPPSEHRKQAFSGFSYRFNARLTRRLWRVAVEAQVGILDANLKSFISLAIL
jgi:hypothetical protein